MPSNSEMYELGALDAEHDDLNAFYYQHYYYYRKGYDEARRQIRGGLAVLRPEWLLAVVAVLAIAGVAAWLLSSFDVAGMVMATPTAERAAVATVTATPASASPTAAPTPTPAPTRPPTMRVGGQARVVNVGDSTLRAREEPGLTTSSRIVARFPDGSQVTVVEGPQEADGLTWWRVSGAEGEGWSAERSPDGVVLLEPLP